MSVPSPPLALGQRFRLVTIIWVAMIASVIVYWLVVELMTRVVEYRFGGSVPEVLRWVLLGVAFVLPFAATLVRRSMLAASGPTPAGTPPEVRVQTAAVITFALCEASAVLGLVWFMLTARPEEFYPFLVIALASLVYHRPRYADWEAWVRERAQHRTG